VVRVIFSKNAVINMGRGIVMKTDEMIKIYELNDEIMVNSL